MIERRTNVRYIEGQPFRDTPLPRQAEKRNPLPEWVRRAKERALPAKVLLP